MRLLSNGLRGLTQLLLLAVVMLVGWGSNDAIAQFFSSSGGGTGGFTGRPLITVEISADKTSVPVNLAGQPVNPALPYTSTITVKVKQDGRLIGGTITVDRISGSSANGSLFKIDDPDQNAFQRIVLEETSGIGVVYFRSNTQATEPDQPVTITATAQDPDTKQTVSSSVQIAVVGESRPATSMVFTGPYINAVIAGQSRFGTPAIQNGAYSRVVSVVVNDANGNPTNPNTQINFFLIDGPITGYPNNPGSFFITGSDGNPQEGGLTFSAPTGNFLTREVHALDRLVLSGGQTRMVQTVTSESSLTIRSANPFGPDSRTAIPYVIGRAENAAILSPSFTGLNGVASTILTYPVTRIGQTAILVACTTDYSTCAALNTCDAAGANCKSVFLGATNGSDRTLTVSTAALGPNRTTNVRMCLRDPNFTPLPATEIRYNIGSVGPAKVVITQNGQPTVTDEVGNRGKFSTGEDGCTTVAIASSGQIPGGQPIEIQFTSDYVAASVPITIKAPGAGKMDGFFNCEFQFDKATATCTGTLRLTDDEGSPMSGILIALGTSSAAFPFKLTFDPAEGIFGKTSAQGQVKVTIQLDGPGAYTFPFQTASGGTAKFEFKVTVPTPGTLKVTMVGDEEATVNTLYSAVFQAEGGVPPYSWSLLSGALPTGLPPLNLNGSISGTPTTVGSFNFSIQAKDSKGMTGFGTFTIKVVSGGSTGEKLDIPTTTLPDATVGIPYTVALSATGGTTPYQWSVTGAPAGITVDRLTGFLVGTPTTVGVFNFIVQVTDGTAPTPQSKTANLTLTVKEGDDGGGGGGGSTANPEALGLSTTQTSVKSNNSDEATITAVVLDGANVGINGKAVTFSATGGQLSASTVVTDSSGNASVKFRSGTVNSDNQVAYITATVARTATTANPSLTLTRVIPVQIGGTSLTITASKTSLPAGGAVSVDGQRTQISVTVSDAGTAPIFDTPVCFLQTRRVSDAASSPVGSLTFFDLQQAVITGSTCSISGMDGSGVQLGRTDVNGVLTVLATGVNDGNLTLNVGASGARVSQDFAIQPTGQAFRIIAPAVVAPATSIPPQIINIGSFTVTVEDSRPGASRVRFTTSLGTWDGAPGGSPTIIDVPVVNERASAVLRSTNAGLANVVVSDVDTTPVLSDNIQLQFTANICDATKLILDASPRVVPISINGAQNVSTLVATLLTGLDQPVADAVVGFSLDTSTGGGEIISPPTAVTSATGEAKTTFISGARASTADGVIVLATVNKPATCASSNPLTYRFRMVITDKAGSVTIGRSTIVEDINDKTAYSLPMSVLVADINGNPVRNTQVNLSAWPLQYNTGVRAGIFSGTFVSANPSLAVVSDTFDNEDRNENTICDQPVPPNTPTTSVCDNPATSEDDNGDGVLTPANTTAGNLPLKVFTDDNGLATFRLVYLKEYADWVVDRIRASALVGGTQIVSEAVFTLTGSVADETAVPPVLPDSPFNAVCPFARPTATPNSATISAGGGTTGVAQTAIVDIDFALPSVRLLPNKVTAIIDNRNITGARVSASGGVPTTSPFSSTISAAPAGPITEKTGGTAVVRYLFSCAPPVDVNLTVKP